MAKEQPKPKVIAYDMDNGFTYCGEIETNKKDMLKHCCVVPTGDLIYGPNGMVLAYESQMRNLYQVSEESSQPVKISLDKVVAVHKIDIK